MGELLVSRDLLEELLAEATNSNWSRLNELLNGSAPDLLPTKTLDLIDQMVVIVLEGDPRGKGRPRFSTHGGFVKVYTDAATAEYEELIQIEVLRHIGKQALIDRTRQIKRASFIQAYKDFGGKPIFTGPVRMEMEIAHPIRASWSKKKQEAARLGLIAPTIKVDFDNCAKIWCDAFNGCMWVDDTQVVEAHIVKRFSDDPYVLVRVIPLDILPA